MCKTMNELEMVVDEYRSMKTLLDDVAKQQIRIAFEQAEKEVADLHQRTKEGIETARLAGKQIGRVPVRN